MNALSPRQKLFCVEYIKDGNATRSYKSAYGGMNGGVAGANANRLLKNEKVRKYIDDLQEYVTGELSADAAEVREYWTSVMRGEVEVEDVEVVVTDGGIQQERFNRTPTHTERLKAAEYLAKAHGLFIDKLKMDVTSGGQPLAPVMYLPMKSNNAPKSGTGAAAAAKPAVKRKPQSAPKNARPAQNKPKKAGAK